MERPTPRLAPRLAIGLAGWRAAAVALAVLVLVLALETVAWSGFGQRLPRLITRTAAPTGPSEQRGEIRVYGAGDCSPPQLAGERIVVVCGDRYRWQVVVITTTTGEWYVRMISPAPLGGSSEQATPTAPDRDRTAGRR